MKYIITGSLGNISKPLATQLIRAGHQVTVISSDANKKKEIESMGALAAIGNIHDEVFLNSAFSEADAVYTMIPPNLQSTDFLKYAADIATKYANAIQKAGIRRVVNLSSIGADLSAGTGPILGNREAEAILNRLEGFVLTHVRACFFYTNFYGNMEMIRNMGILGSNYPGSSRVAFVHPEDIARMVAEELQNDKGSSGVRYISSDDRTAQEAATALGKAIGIAALPWVEFPDDQFKSAFLQAGFSEEMAFRFVEMGQSVRSGKIWEHYDAAGTGTTGKIKLEDFAKEFAARYSGAK